MTYETVTVTQVRALDGSLHRDRAAAEAHDRYVAEQRLEELLGEIFWSSSTHQGGSLFEHLDVERWEREGRLREITDIVRARFPRGAT